MSEPQTTVTPDAACLNCGAHVDRATSVEGHRPSPGDVSICLHCQYVAVFDDDLRPREATEDELKAMAGHPTLRLYVDMMARIKRGATA